MAGHREHDAPVAGPLPAFKERHLAMSNGKKTPSINLVAKPKNIADDKSVSVFGILTDSGFTVIDVTDTLALASGYAALAAGNLPDEQKTKGFVLKPERVAAIVRGFPGNAKNDDEIQKARVMALIAENGVEQNKPASMTAQIGDPNMLALAEMVPDNDPIFKHVDMALDGKKDWEGAPLVCAIDFRRIYGRMVNEDGSIKRASSLSQFPHWGSSTEDYPEDQRSNVFTDIYFVTNETTGKPEKRSRVEEWWTSLAKGRLQKLTLLQAQAIASGKEPLADTPAHLLRNKGKEIAAAQAVKDARAELTSSLNRLGKALNFCHVADRIDEDFPKVTWKFSRASDEHNGWDATEQEIIDSSRSTVPIRLLSTTVGADNPPASALSGFLNLRVDSAETTEKVNRLGKDQVALADLLPKRAPRKSAEEKRAAEAAKLVGKADKEGLGIPLLPNNAQAQSMMWGLCNFFDKSENLAAIYIALDPKKEGSNELVMTIGQLQMHVANLYSKVAERYVAMTAPKPQAGVVVNK
jgi:hypothetical protein